MKKIIQLFLLSIMFIVSSEVKAQVSEQDSLALVAFYNATNGASWTNNTNWLSNVPANNWNGVIVTDGRVTNLNLPNNGLTGSIPSEIGNLTGLTRLDLTNNQLTGSIPTEIGSLTNLNELLLDNNQLTGTIPSEITQLTKLVKISLNDNQLTGSIPTGIGSLTDLTRLHLFNNLLTGSIPTQIGSLTNLINLLLYNNQLTGTIPSQITQLTKLININIEDNQLTGEIPSQIGQLTSLSTLVLNNNQMTGNIPAGIANLNMTRLSLAYNNFTGPIPTQIGTWEFLYYLELNDNHFTDLPDLNGLPDGSLITVENNKFEFDDLESNISVLTSYSPQDSVGLADEKIIVWGEPLNLTITTSGDNNTYQWYKDDIPLEDQTSKTLEILFFNLSNVGGYRVEVKNTLVPDLTLFGRVTAVGIDSSTLNVQITKPEMNEKWMAGEKDTIRWTGGASNQALKVEYSIDEGKTFEHIGIIYPATLGMTEWEIPDTTLTTRARIRISDYGTNNNILDETENFRIKPYVITRLKKGSDGLMDYVAYDIKKDSWGFGNTSGEVWPASFYNQTNYQKDVDPNTKIVYSKAKAQVWAAETFTNTKSSEHVDWKSWVKTFGGINCYFNYHRGSEQAYYANRALNRWKATKGKWGGSCFGIAAANAIAFEDSAAFASRFSDFPAFDTARTVKSNLAVIDAVTELFAHEFGNPFSNYWKNDFRKKTPTQSMNEIKQMLKEDEVNIRSLLFINNNGKGAHAINVFKLKQNPDNLKNYDLYVWDNSYPDSLKAKIVIDTSANGGNGSWDVKYGWSGWGGSKWFALDLPSKQYLSRSTIPKTSEVNSPFILNENELEVFNPSDANIEIKDNQGNITGFNSDGSMTEIPNSVPLIRLDGSENPPYGYSLVKDNYSITMNNFTKDTINAFAFSGNKIFEYERSGATNSQTDKLFFDGGISVTNPDTETKSVKLLNVISDPTSGSEKLFSINSLNLSQNDSVKIVNPDEDNLDIISYGSEKTYKIEIEYVSEGKVSSFSNDNVVLTANSTQKIVPNWEKTGDLEISVYVDEGNDGTIDDTVSVENQVTGVYEEHGSIIPTEFRLEQNYPNPFNPVTNIKYSIAKTSKVTITVFDILGKEIATLVSEQKTPGVYEVQFDATRLTSGVYFYTIRANNFIQTKKMLLMK